MTQVRSVSHALAILRLIGESGPLSLSDVARAQGLSPSSCLSILRTLVGEGALEREARAKRYRLTPEWSAASPFSADRVQKVVDRLRPAMLEISKEFDATVGLWKVASGRRLWLVAHMETDAPMRIQMAPGQRQPLGGGVVGRMLSAVQGVDDSELARRFAETRWERPITLKQYIAEVKRARAQGFAIDDGILHAGICSVGAALPDPYAGFSISISIFAGSRSKAEIECAGERLAERCRALGQASG